MSGKMPPELPYHWSPDAAIPGHPGERPPAGALVAWRHAAWRVIDVGDVPAEWWSDQERTDVATWGPRGVPYRIVLRPARLGDDPRDRDHDLHLRCPGRCEGWYVYRHSHYPVCVECGEPTPCREQMAERQAAAGAEKMGRYETPGVCPACQEPVTRRQKAITFEGNLEVPAGPPVTFHLRARCHYSAYCYEKRWVQAQPETRRYRLYCPGWITNHGDGTYECTRGERCAGPVVNHEGFTTCGDRACWPDPDRRDCRPQSSAVRRDGRAAA